MIALSVSDVSLSFGADVVLKNISFSLNDGDRVGVIGANGAGKTSLFRIITGEYSSDSGAVYIQKGHTVGCLEQNPDLSALPGELRCIDYMFTAFSELLELEERIAVLEKTITELSEQGKHESAVRKTEELSLLNQRFDALGGMEFRGRCRAMLQRLGFDAELIDGKISELSGGQYTRLALARLLATEPDILMLDEPTNHLDTDALAWLESFISSYKKTVIIISHDRYFLDRTTSKTLHIQNSGAKLYHGNYSAAKEQEVKDTESLDKRYREQQKIIAKIKANIEFQRRCNREHNFVTIRSKEKQLAKMENIELSPREKEDIKIRFCAEERSPSDVLEAKGLSFSYGERPIIKGLSFLVKRHERVLFLGRNGCGKSTLMKLINSLLPATEGKLILGYNIKIGYYDQENRGLSLNKTVFEQLRDAYPDKTNLELRSTLALFLFGADDIDKLISTLSGGERARLTLASLMLKKVNLLVLDEPTNHLDISSAEALENALLAFDGTIIAVSHDRYFINRIATRIIELDSASEGGMIDYRLEDYDDAYSEYIRIRSLYREAKMAEAKQKEKDKQTVSRQDYERRKRENAEKRGAEKRAERARLKIAELEAELEKLDEELFGEAATNYVRATQIELRKAEIEEELLALYEIAL